MRLPSIRGARRQRQESGQALVEMALVVPIFLLVLVAVFDVGLYVYTNSVVSQAAREGARLGATEAAWIGVSAPNCVADESAIGPGNPGAHVCPPDVPAFKADIVDAANRMTTAVGPVDALWVSCNDGTVGDPAPSGAWTGTSGGNGCKDGSGDPISGSGDLVSVRVEHTYVPITPIINDLIGPVPLSGAATMVVH